MMAMLAGPAYSQQKGGNYDVDPANKDPLQLQYEREQREREQNEKSYNETMKRLKTQAPTKTNSDPWKIVRPTTDSSGKR
jgi:hypothetical protein